MSEPVRFSRHACLSSAVEQGGDWRRHMVCWLPDNLEWPPGFAGRSGIVHVNIECGAGAPGDSSPLYATNAATTNAATTNAAIIGACLNDEE